MKPTPHIGKCESCGDPFRFELVHAGSQRCAYAYCDACGRTALLETRRRSRRGIESHERIDREGEPWLRACDCGGCFRSAASPRCPACLAPLNPEMAKRYIEAAIQPVAAGWKWQGNWHGLYVLIVNERIVENPWKPD